MGLGMGGGLRYVMWGVGYRGWCQSGHGGGRDWGRCRLSGQGGGREWGVDEIGEGVARIGHGGGCAEIVIKVGVYSPMC